MRSFRSSLASIRSAVIAVVLLCCAACDGESAPDGGVAAARVYPRFAPSADPMDFGAVPFPDDLYLDSAGHIALGALPSEADALDGFSDAMRRGLAELDGFSTVAPIFFYFPPSSIDVTSLPAGAAESTREDSSVFLLDADPASPTAFRRVPVTINFHPGLGQLAIRPWDGYPLASGRRYAAVVTTSVRDDLGMPIGPDPRFAEVRDAEARPTDEILGEAYDRYSAVLASLASNGIARERVAGLAVFTVQHVAPDMRDARDAVWSGAVPSVILDAAIAAGPEMDALLGVPSMDLLGVDVPGGVVHRNIAWVIQGRFGSPRLDSPRPGVHGVFARDESGALIVQRTDEVPFTLTLPAGDITRVPLVIFQHGLGGERSDMFAVADALAAAGHATLAIDIPYHGMRALGANLDFRHRFGATEGPDGFGDRSGADVQLQFLGALDTRGELVAFHPSYVRDVLRQSAVDLMRAVRMIREGDLGSVRARVELSTLGFASAPIAFVGVSLGGIVGTIFVASEMEIGAAALVVTGGDLSRLVENSANFAPLFTAILIPKLGIDASALEPTLYPLSFHPELALYQTVLDRGDSISFAPRFSTRPIDVLFQMAEHDEAMPNRATEALARAAGAQIIDADAVHTDLSRASSPIAGNIEVDTARATRGLYRFAPATHGLLSNRTGIQGYAHPPEPPFVVIETVAVENPVDIAVDQIVHFFLSYRGGAAEIVATPP